MVDFRLMAALTSCSGLDIGSSVSAFTLRVAAPSSAADGECNSEDAGIGSAATG